MKRLVLASAVLSTLLLAGCATDPYYGSSYSQPYHRNSSVNTYERDQMNSVQNVTYGRVETVRWVTVERSRGLGAGAVIGAVVGGVIGNQIGSGHGRDLATVGGAVAGGAIGNKVQNDRNRQNAYEVTVRLDNGQRISIVQGADYTFSPGQKVRVVGYGDEARVVPN